MAGMIFAGVLYGYVLTVIQREWNCYPLATSFARFFGGIIMT
jgi:hypothetical protein